MIDALLSLINQLADPNENNASVEEAQRIVIKALT